MAKATDAMGRDWFQPGVSARTTKGTPQGMGYVFNKLPPGQFIEDQDTAHISDMVRKNITSSGYPGSGGFTDEGDTVTGKTYKPAGG
jgi:hypothetical protein